MSCMHTAYRLLATVPFSGTVARHPYTEENPRAAGGVCEIYECESCGARRHTNANGMHREHSPWGRSLRDRKAEFENAWRGVERAIAAAPGISVVVDGKAVELALDSTAHVVADADVATAQRAFDAAPEAWRVAAQNARLEYRRVSALPDPSENRSY